MGYSIDLKSISLPAYRDMLKTKELPTSRRLLHQGINAAFAQLQKGGFEDAEALLKGLSTPKKIKDVSQKTGVSAEYLALLKRELGGLEVKSMNLGAFPYLSPDILSPLTEKGLKDSEDVYEYTQCFAEPQSLCDLAGISEPQAREVCALCDLVRISGVGKVFAHILYDAGYRCLREIAEEDATHLRDNANRIGVATYGIESLGLRDAQYCIDSAALLLKG
jgi:hypothetical protein